MMTSIKGSGHAAVVQSGSEKRRECGNECINQGGGGGLVLGIGGRYHRECRTKFYRWQRWYWGRGRVESGRGSRNTGTESKGVPVER